MRYIFPLALLSVGCRSVLPEDTESDVLVDTDTDTDTTTWEGFRPHAFGLTDAQFAVDASGRAIGWHDPGGAQVPVRLVFVFGAEGVPAASFGPDDSCTVTFEHPGPIAKAAWATPLSAYTAFELPDDATATSDCSRLDFPPAWSDGPEAALRRWKWGFGVGPLDPAVKDGLEQSLGDDFAEVEYRLAGGGYFWDGLVRIEDLPNDDWQDGWVDTSVVFAYEADATGQRTLVEGDTVPLDAGTLESGPSVRPAWYDVQASTLLTPASLLLREVDP